MYAIRNKITCRLLVLAVSAKVDFAFPNDEGKSIVDFSIYDGDSGSIFVTTDRHLAQALISDGKAAFALDGRDVTLDIIPFTSEDFEVVGLAIGDDALEVAPIPADMLLYMSPHQVFVERHEAIDLQVDHLTQAENRRHEARLQQLSSARLAAIKDARAILHKEVGRTCEWIKDTKCPSTCKGPAYCPHGDKI